MHKISYLGDGTEIEFVFRFPFFQESDIRVTINNHILDNSFYDVDANENFDGGIVTFSTPPADGDMIDIFRKISLERIVDYQPTAKIDPENLNADFNFLLEAFKDLREIDIDLEEWHNIHEKVVSLMEYTLDVVQDKLSGGAVLGLYSNLLSVLDAALPKLINDYGSVSEPAANDNRDDYGIL